MRNHWLYTATVLPLVLTGACTLSSDQTDDPITTECGTSDCGDNKHDGGDDCNGGHDCNGGGSGGGDCSGQDGCDGTDVDLDLDLDAHLSLQLVGSGLFVGLTPGCGLDVSGEFYASATASATFDNELDAFVIADVGAVVDITTGSGCACEGISVDAMASVSVDASIDVNVDSCKYACGSNSSCESTCLGLGAQIVAKAHVAVDANASISIGGQSDSDLDVLVGTKLDLDLEAIVDVDGNVVVDL